jgi:hypothetical protein
MYGGSHPWHLAAPGRGVYTGAGATAAGKAAPPAARPATGNKGAPPPAGSTEALAAGVQAAIDSCKAEVQAAASSYYTSKVSLGCVRERNMLVHDCMPCAGDWDLCGKCVCIWAGSYGGVLLVLMPTVSTQGAPCSRLQHAGSEVTCKCVGVRWHGTHGPGCALCWVCRQQTGPSTTRPSCPPRRLP